MVETGITLALTGIGNAIEAGDNAADSRRCREPGRHSTLDKGHEEGGSAYANGGSSLRSRKAASSLSINTSASNPGLLP